MTAALPDALMDAAVYPHTVDDVTLVETHISWVFLAGAFAYKVKKPLKFGFLDYSTLERRAQSCHEELRLNRRLAPDLYLDVVTIGRRGAGLVIGDGEPVEYAVKMRRFPSGSLLADLASSGALPPEAIDDLAQRIARFHRYAAVASPNGTCGHAESILHWTRENFDHIDRAWSEAAELEAWTQAEGARCRPLFEERLATGFVRECHGDLHLGNVIWQDGRATPFDGIEFNAELRWIDVMSEIAFLVMDLVDRGYRALAWRCLNRYLETTGDYGGVRVLRYYIVYRALVRAKVAMLKDPDSVAQREIAGGYLALAVELAHAPPPTLFIMHGFSGSGKTTVAREFAERLPALVIRSDVERKRLAGLDVLVRVGSAVGTGLYSAQVSDATYVRLEELANLVLAAGWSCIVDAAFLKRGQRDRFRSLAARLGIGFRLLDVRASPDVMQQRLRARTQAVDDASDAGLAVLVHQMETHDPLGADEPAERVDG